MSATDFCRWQQALRMNRRPMAEAYSAWRGCSTQHVLDVWLLAAQGTQVPASARA